MAFRTLAVFLAGLMAAPGPASAAAVAAAARAGSGVRVAVPAVGAARVGASLSPGLGASLSAPLLNSGLVLPAGFEPASAVSGISLLEPGLFAAPAAAGVSPAAEVSIALPSPVPSALRPGKRRAAPSTARGALGALGRAGVRPGSGRLYGRVFDGLSAPSAGGIDAPVAARTAAAGPLRRAGLGRSTDDSAPPASGDGLPSPRVRGPKGVFAGLAKIFVPAAVLILAGDFFLTFGNEIWGTVFPKWGQARFGAGVYSTAMMVSMALCVAAPLVGGWVSDKIGPRKTAVAFWGLAGASIAGMLLLYDGGGLTPALMIGLVAALESLYVAGAVAANTLPISIFKGRRKELEGFNAYSALLGGIPGIVAPLSVGLFMAKFGVLGTLWVLPVTVAAGLVFYSLVKGGKVKEEDSAPAGPKDPKLLRLGLLAYPAVYMFNYLMWYSLAVGYGSFVFPGAGELAEQGAITVAGRVMSFHSVGWFIGAFFTTGLLSSLWWRLRGRNAPDAAADAPARSNRSLALWMGLAAAGLLGFVPFMWTSVGWAALGMIPFGLTSAVTQAKLMALVQSNVPEERKGRVMGRMKMASLAVIGAAMFGFNALAAAYPASPFPFAILLGALALVAAYYLWIARAIRRHTKSLN